MGTLTGSTPSLSEHCDHKLPTSCRLTASPTCCACQDVRPHTGLYTTYVDGIGLVQRGTRWQRYCYFCREFWENRVAATEPPMNPRQTRIPDVPDQKPFLDKWFEYHRGFKLRKREDSDEEEMVEVVCEKPWRDVDPGTLPVLNAAERRMALSSVQQTAQTEPITNVSLDATLEDLMDAAATEEQDSQPPEINQTSDNARNGSQQHLRVEAEAQLDAEELQQTLERLKEAEARYRSAQMRRQRATCELTAAEAELNDRQAQKLQAQREHQAVQSRQQRRIQQAQVLERMMRSREEMSQRAAQRFARVFGTQEEFQQQGANYVSPLTSLFTRAYERYRVAEEVRAEERASTENSHRHREVITNLAQQQYPGLFAAIQDRVEREIAAETFQKTLDDDEDQRPPPKTEEQMTVRLACKVCLQQTADTAVLPCGHLVMCSYCADICVPARANDQTQPIGKAQCPMCRKKVKRRARIFTS